MDLDWKYQSRIDKLEKENIYLYEVVARFKNTIAKFIKWICKKFDMGVENNLIRDFERESGIFLDAEKQIKWEERKFDRDLEL